jgi:hypothetical protein
MRRNRNFSLSIYFITAPYHYSVVNVHGGLSFRTRPWEVARPDPGLTGLRPAPRQTTLVLRHNTARQNAGLLVRSELPNIHLMLSEKLTILKVTSFTSCRAGSQWWR